MWLWKSCRGCGFVKCSDLILKLVWGTDSTTVENAVNEYLKANPELELDHDQLIAGNYSKKVTRNPCPTCGSELWFNPRNLNGPAQCKRCKIDVDRQEAAANTRIDYVPGTFYLVGIWLRKGDGNAGTAPG